MWQRFKEWLLREEFRRLRADAAYEQDTWMKDYRERRRILELEYAMIKRENKHLLNLIVEQKMLETPRIILDKNSVN